MKDSGVEWIGAIPATWTLNKIGEIYEERNEKVSDRDYPPLSITKQGVVPQLETAAKTDNGDNRKLIRKNDFVINSRSDRRGSCGISEYDGSCSLINTVLNPRQNMCNAYYSFVFRSELFADEFYRWGNGIVDDLWSTKWSNMKRIYIPSPDIEEQQRIAEYLDRKCQRIDSVIARQQEAIEKLKAYKLSVITEAVTKGLNPDVPMKDSCVEWMGKIPANWGIQKLKYSTTIMRGKFSHRPRNDPRCYDGKHPFVQTGDVARASKYITTYSQTLNEFGYTVSKEFPKGSICMTIAANVGDVAVLGFDACFPDSVVGFVPNNNVEWNYLYYVLKAMKQQLMRNAIISTQMNLNIDIIKEEYIPLPSIAEQKEIMLYLVRKCVEIENAIHAKQQTVDKLSEYKKSLIYEVVTGKQEV